MGKKFEDLCTDGKCDCCGEETKTVVIGSLCGPISYQYCKRCFDNRYEPYEGIVAYISSSLCLGQEHLYKDKVSEFFVEFISNNLKFHNKTEEQFIQDMRLSNKRLIEYIEKQLETLEDTQDEL